MNQISSDHPLFHKDHLLDAVEAQRVRRYIDIVGGFLNSMPVVFSDILDVGASDGRLGNSFRNANYIAIDPIPDAPGVVAKTLFQYNTENVFDSFDLIVFNHVLEHIPNYEQEVSLAAAMLRRGGLMFIATPEASSPWAYDLDAHYNLFNLQTTKKMVERQGLNCVEQLTLTLRQDRTEIWTVAKKP